MHVEYRVMDGRPTVRDDRGWPQDLGIARIGVSGVEIAETGNLVEQRPRRQGCHGHTAPGAVRHADRPHAGILEFGLDTPQGFDKRLSSSSS